MGPKRTSPKSLEDPNSNFSGSIHNQQKQQQPKMRITVTSPQQYSKKQNALASVNEVFIFHYILLHTKYSLFHYNNINIYSVESELIN